MSIHPKRLWEKSRHIDQQGKFYNTTNARRRRVDLDSAQQVDATLPEPVTETKLPGEIQFDKLGRVIMPEPDQSPQNPGRRER